MASGDCTMCGTGFGPARREAERLAMRSPGLTAALGIVLVVLVLLGAYVVRMGYPAELRARLGAGGPSAQVVDLHSIDQLKAAFNDDVGTARLLVLFSPT